MIHLKTLSLSKRYQTRAGYHIVRLEHDLNRVNPDGFSWRGWHKTLDGREVWHWYNRYGQWSNGIHESELDLIEAK